MRNWIHFRRSADLEPRRPGRSPLVAAPGFPHASTTISASANRCGIHSSPFSTRSGTPTTAPPGATERPRTIYHLDGAAPVLELRRHVGRPTSWPCRRRCSSGLRRREGGHERAFSRERIDGGAPSSRSSRRSSSPSSTASCLDFASLPLLGSPDERRTRSHAMVPSGDLRGRRQRRASTAGWRRAGQTALRALFYGWFGVFVVRPRRFAFGSLEIAVADLRRRCVHSSSRVVISASMMCWYANIAGHRRASAW